MAAALADLEAAPDRRFLLAAAAAGMAATALACLALHLLSLNGTYGELTDALFVTPFWQDAQSIAAGFVPYRDIPIEYPPMSLPVFILPAVLPGGGLDYPRYRTMFELLMALCAIALVPLTAWTIARAGGGRSAILLGIGFVAVAPLLLGPLTISRYDLWPALLTAAATLAMVSGRPRTAFALLALGTLAKVYPVFLAPIFAWYAWRTVGGREVVRGVAAGAVVGLAGLAPFLAIDADGALGPFTRTLARPLQAESIGASILSGLHAWVGLPVGPVTYGYGSYNLGGPLTEDVSSLASGAFIGALLVVWAIAIAGPARPDRFVLACAAALACTVALGKILSPQYVLWLVPAVAVTASFGARAIVGLAGILALTQVYFPARYMAYLTGSPGATTLILERNAGLVLLAIWLAALTWRWTRPPAPRPDPPADRAPAAA